MRRLLLTAAACLLPAAAFAQAPGCGDLAARWEAGKTELQVPQISALLFSASDRGCAPLAKTLLDAGALLEAKDRFGNTPLGHAAREGQVGMLDLLLARGAELDHRNLGGSTALFAAIERKRPEAALFLIGHGANPNLPGRSGATPLAAAAFTGLDSVAAALLQHGADPKTPDTTGKPPIVYALAGSGSLAIATALLDAGVAADARYGNDLTALMWVAGHADTVSEAQGVALAELLLARGAQVNDADNRGRTPLMIAAEQGHAAIAKLLLAHGANPAATDKQGKSARDLAANEDVKAVLAKG